MAAENPLAQANTSFALDLLIKLSDNDPAANVFFSPFSISSALAMVLLGAGGNTATQMSKVLHFQGSEKSPQAREMQMQQQTQQQMQTQTQMQQHPTQQCLRTQDDVHSKFGELLPQLHRSDAPYALSVANRLYGEQSYEFVEAFQGGTKNYYKTELESVDFVTKSEEARVNINDWVEKQTQGKIKDLLAQGVVDSMTKLVLVNAIYFKGNWNKQFKESATRDAKFRINKNETRPVKMMYQESTFPLTFIPEANCQIIELPYKGKELSMFIFLPMEIEGLLKLQQKLTCENFEKWTRPGTIHETEVQVGLPRFKMEETYDLKNVLISLGMVEAFDMGLSDFSGMSPDKNLVLSKVAHKAFVEVNEEGTEAAAATAAVITLCCLPPTFIADHPFLFFICHKASRSILFAGRYCSPV